MPRFFPHSVLALSLVACNADTQDPNSKEPADSTQPEPSEGAAQIQGDAPAPGTVTVLRRGEDGFEPAGGPTATDEDGHYETDAHAAVGLRNDFVLVWEGEDGATASALVTAVVGADGQVHAADLGAESSAEAELYLALVAAGGGEEESDAILTRLLVDADVAATLDAEAETEAAAEVVARASASFAATVEATGSAALDLSAELLAEADEAEATDGRFEAGATLDLGAFLDAMEAEVDSEAEGRALSVGLNAAVAGALACAEEGGTTEGEAVLGAKLALERNAWSSTLVLESLAELGLDAETDSAESDAGIEALVEGVVSGEGEAAGEVDLEAALDEAWGEWSASILAELTADMGGSEEAEVEEGCEAAAELRAELQARLEAAGGEDAFEAFASFYAEAEAEVAAGLEEGGFEAAEAELVAAVIVELSAAGTSSE